MSASTFLLLLLATLAIKAQANEDTLVRVHLERVEDPQKSLNLYFLLKEKHEQILLQKHNHNHNNHNNHSNHNNHNKHWNLRGQHERHCKQKGKALAPFNMHYQKRQNRIFTRIVRDAKVKLRNINNIMYFGDIQIGSQPSNLFSVIFDTGSSIIFTNSAECKSVGCRKTSNVYDYKQSATSVQLNQKLRVTFGSGAVAGFLVKDRFSLGGHSLSDVTFLDVITQHGDVFRDGQIEGLVGLAFKEMFGYPTLFDHFRDQHNLQSNQFSFYMSRTNGLSQSQVIFGGKDDSLIRGTWTHHRAINDLYWMLEATQIRVGDTDTAICSQTHKCKLVIDTGTSVLTGPSEDIVKILSLIPVEDKCRNFYQMPDITIRIDSTDYVLTPTDYAVTYKYGKTPELYKPLPKDQIDGCAAAIFPFDMKNYKDKIWIMGNMFLSKYAVLFDQGKRSIAFAPLSI